MAEEKSCLSIRRGKREEKILVSPAEWESFP